MKAHRDDCDRKTTVLLTSTVKRVVLPVTDTRNFRSRGYLPPPGQAPDCRPDLPAVVIYATSRPGDIRRLFTIPTIEGII